VMVALGYRQLLCLTLVEGLNLLVEIRNLVSKVPSLVLMEAVVRFKNLDFAPEFYHCRVRFC
jgi:hypothetical protein